MSIAGHAEGLRALPPIIDGIGDQFGEISGLAIQTITPCTRPLA